MSTRGKTLIVFAWAMETVGVACGVANSTYTTFGEHLPTTWIEYIPALPMLVLAVAEFGRVPLASVIFNKHKLIQGVAMIGILALRTSLGCPVFLQKPERLRLPTGAS